MAKMEFNTQTFEMIQNLAFPLIATLTGFDPAEWAGDKAELFLRVGDGFADVSKLFIVIGEALEDGRLTSEELEAIITQAKTLPDAIDNISGFFDGDDEPVEE